MSASMTFDFSGARVVVVGASQAGIGAAIARSFRDSGAEVTITGIEEAPAEEDRRRFEYVRLDVRDYPSVAEFARRFQALDILVNCAAITMRGEEMQCDVFETVVDVNLLGSFRTAKAFHAPLKASAGSVVNVASMYAFFGSPRNPGYGASKAAVAQLTKSLAILWASDNVRVNAVAPGFVITQQSARSRTDPEHVAAVDKRTPMGRWGRPEDIAGPVLFLASDAARFVTGTCLAVDGGYSVA